MSSPLSASSSALTELYDVALLDLDGVVYVGPEAVPGAAQALGVARERGIQLAFVTNNAARPPHAVADHLVELGIAAKAAEVVTSAQAAARHLADRLPGGARVLVVGTTGLTEALRERGLVPVQDANGQVDAVVQGYTPDLTWALFAEGAVAVNRGVLWVATNVDRTIPSARGPLPGNGAFVVAMQHATGRDPVVTGKPDPTMHRESVLRTGAERPIVVGDRLDTDIEGANAAGCASLLVFTGVTDPAALLAADARLRPTYLAPNLDGLLVRHPQPRSDGDAWVCGQWQAQVSGTELELRSGRSGGSQPSDAGPASGDPGDGSAPGGPFDGDATDALRALCAAWWSRADSPESGRAPTVRAAGDEAETVLRALGLGD